MPMEMSSLGPMVGKLVGFLGPVKIEESQKTKVFVNKSIEHVFLMGKSIEHLQCHRIYIQHIWRYGSRFLTLTPISGWFHQSFPISRRPVGAPALEIHRGKHQKNWTKLDILGVDNNLVPLQE